MRQKTRPSVGRPRRRPTPGSQSTPDWLIENELGWGLPHAGFALLAGLVVAARAVGWELDRLDAWLERRDRARDPGGPPADRA